MVEQKDGNSALPGFLKEKRCMFDRIPSRFPVKFKDTRQDFGADVRLRDFSAEGAGITTKERLFLNDSVALEVELPDGKEPMTMRGEVVWANKRDIDMWDFGLKFHKIVLMDMWRIYKAAEPNSSV